MKGEGGGCGHEANCVVVGGKVVGFHGGGQYEKVTAMSFLGDLIQAERPP